MLTFNFPPRPILRFGSASVTVPMADAPLGSTTTSSTLTSSTTSKGISCPTFASAEEIVWLRRSLTGVPSRKVWGAGGCDGAPGADCAALLPGAELEGVGGCWATSKGQSVNEQVASNSLRISSPLGEVP